MRNEFEIMSDFRNLEAATEYSRQRVMLEVLLDVRALLREVRDLEKDEKSWRDKNDAKTVLLDGQVARTELVEPADWDRLSVEHIDARR